MTNMKTVAALTALFFVVLFSSSAFAESVGIIKYRQNVMKSTGAHMGAIVDILKNRLPLEAHLLDHARSISQNSKMTLAMFPKGSALGKTKAKADIWKNWSQFENAVNAFVRESTKLVKIVESGDMKAFTKQFRTTGKTCGGCHKNFRERD